MFPLNGSKKKDEHRCVPPGCSVTVIKKKGKCDYKVRVVIKSVKFI